MRKTPTASISDDSDAPNTTGERWEQDGNKRSQQQTSVSSSSTCEGNISDDTNGVSKGLEGRGEQGQGLSGQSSGTRSNQRRVWNKNWVEVATEFCRVDDGLPVELDGFKLSKSRHRVERLKSLGNSIVPQVAMEIMKAIKFSKGV